MGSGLETIRTFVAVNLSLQSLRAIAEMQRELRSELKRTGASVRWVPSANMHQTVKFLGDVDVELTEGIAAALKSVAADVAPFRLEAFGFGAFPNPGRPRVIWVGIKDPAGGLLRLHQGVEAALEVIGFPMENRPFRPHVTLGRVKRGACDLSDAVARFGERSFGTSTVSELTLYESRLHRSGAEYVARARVPLSGVLETPPGPEAAAAGSTPGEGPAGPPGSSAQNETNGQATTEEEHDGD